MRQREVGRGRLVAVDDRLEQGDVFPHVARDVGQTIQEQAPDPRRMPVQSDQDLLEVRVSRRAIDLPVHVHVAAQDLTRIVGVVDVGDAKVSPGDLEASYVAIEAAVGAIAETRAVAVTLGGDGAIALPEMRALHRVYPDLVTVHIDAHTDAYPIEGYNTATAFGRAAEEGLVDATRSSQVGIFPCRPLQTDELTDCRSPP